MAAILLSSALFAVVHPPIAVIPVFGLGVACAYGLERTGNLLAPAVTHMIYNAAVVFFLN